MILRHAVSAMGTRFEMALAGQNEQRLRAVAELAAQAILEWDRRLSLFRTDSIISRINREAAVHPVRVDGGTFDLLRFCAEVHRLSAGTFDITVGALMRAWGFRGIDEQRREGESQSWGADALLLDEAERTVRFTRPGIEIDLGAVGKGHALDCAAAVVRECGVGCAFLHGGTSTAVGIGTPPGETAWRVALHGPGRPPVVELRDSALSVSAPHGRMVERDGRTLGHVLDPRTGKPVPTGAAAAAVVGKSARATDAWSTAVLILGERPPSMPDHLTAILGPEAQDGHWRTHGPMQPAACEQEQA